MIEEINICLGQKQIGSFLSIQSSRIYGIQNLSIEICVDWFRKFHFNNIDFITADQNINQHDDFEWKRNKTFF